MIDTLEDAGITPRRSRNVLPHESNWLNRSVITMSGGLVTVDEPGVGGAGFDLLRAAQFDVRGYNGGSSLPAGQVLQLEGGTLWNLRAALMDGRIAIPPHPGLADALVSLRWSITTKGKVGIEDKQDWKSRLPDAQLADVVDACAMVFDGWTRRGRVPDQRPVFWS